MQRKSLYSWWLTAVLLFVLVLTTTIYGQNSAGETGTRTTEALAAFRGQQVYNRACVACHGKSGDGNGPAAKYLDPRPRDFTAGTYKFRSTPSGELP
ncbi:MAG: c-type cytochrome, partial [bacterium]